MLDDFLIRALLAGVGLALVAGPLGCFVIWRGMAFFGETMAHASLLGVALALLWQVNILWGVLAVCLLVAVFLVVFQRGAGQGGPGNGARLGNDALLGILSHTALALGLVAIGMITWLQVDVMGLLIGDILSVSKGDVLTVFVGGVAVLVALSFIWQPLLLATISTDIARAERRRPEQMQLVLVILLGVVVAMAIKIVGVLLITALLIIPASAARYIARTPEQMAVMASLTGVLAVLGGMGGSLQFDTPSGPSIVVAAALVFVVVLIAQRIIGKVKTGDVE